MSVIKDIDEKDAKVEALAEYAHNAWAGWMEYMFEKGTLSKEGELVIPKNLTIRWNRQMSTKYKDLPEDEKKSDREETRRILKIIGGK